ncbi:YqiA/YcfP family alpha/beta fold hydrolase [Myroides fluvii]|uniref:YqiA/YcfP family alpha/beta fold hydrolase n=1 Tax=Myroides fluvii TaxID=2572594 RepID=UPI00131C0AA4|nr:YqiA/YcfP family alpha/beta fold hydrolase [Myroides fluvii]
MQFIYIHGYGSNRESRKYVLLQTQLVAYQARCPEWTPETDFNTWLKALYQSVENEQTVVVVGDSTGANFAYQLKEMRNAEGLDTILVLLSPLLSYDHRLNKELAFTANLKNSLQDIVAPTEALILIGKQDETLDLKEVNPYACKNSEVVYIDDSHRLPLFEQYLGLIGDYVERQCLILSK